MKQLGILLLLSLVVLWASCGGTGTPAPGPTPTPSNPSYVYVANSGDSTISRFTVNKTNGILSSAGAPASISPGQTPAALGLVNNSLLVSANQDTYNTGVFSIDAKTGALRQVSGSPFSDFGGQRNGIAVHPSGKFIYGTSEPVGVLAYQIDAATGALTLIQGSPFGDGSQIHPVVDLAGKYLYTYSFSSQLLNVYAIDQTTGALTLTPESPIPSNAQFLTGMTFDPSGKFLLGVEAGYVYLHTYAVDPTTGALQEVSGSPVYQPGVDPWDIKIVGNFAFTSNMSRGTIGTWQFDTVNGTLTWVGEVSAGTFPGAMKLDSSRKFLYVANYRSNDISAYSINSVTGALTELPGSPFAVGSFPADIVTTK